VIERRHRRQRDRALDQRHACLGLALLVGDDAHQVQRRVMQRRGRKHMPEHSLGVAQPRGCFMLGGDLHQLRDTIGARAGRRGGNDLERGPGLRRYRTGADLGRRRAVVRSRFGQTEYPSRAITGSSIGIIDSRCVR
jgi:hypothetical protein